MTFPDLVTRPYRCVRALCLAAGTAVLGAVSAPDAAAQPATRPTTAAANTRAPAAPRFQAISMLGDTLRALPLAEPVRARYERQLADARRAYLKTPTNVDSIIWYARRLGYLGRLRESIEIYTRGLALYPDNAWLLRHRGHRWISVRDFDAAVRDLKRADELTRDKPDEVEPDGQPNAANTPIGTLKSNVGYHLALAHYLNGSWGEAATVAQREVDAANNDDRRVSMAHWLYMALRRAGRNDEAAKVLQPMQRDMRIIENQAYHKLMLLYKGVLPADSVLTASATGELSVQDASAAYGVANWHWYNGRRADAEALWRRIVAGGQWGAFGTIAAEVELSRIPGGSTLKR
jgi:tetratricopeptide (TPR) repeat protein